MQTSFAELYHIPTDEVKAWAELFTKRFKAVRSGLRPPRMPAYHLLLVRLRSPDAKEPLPEEGSFGRGQSAAPPVR